MAEVLYPLFWVDEHFDIDKPNADNFVRQVKIPLLFVEIGKYLPIALGTLLILSSLIYSYVQKRNRTRPVVSFDPPAINDETTPLLNNI